MSIETKVNGRFVNKHDTEANWIIAGNASNPFIPKQAEIIVYDIDENYDYERFKIGDGIHNVNELSFTIEDLNLENGLGKTSIQSLEAKALGNNSVALGASISGCKGYRYIAVDIASRKIYLTDNEDDIVKNSDGTAQIGFSDIGFTSDEIEQYTRDITLPYAANDVFTLRMRAYDCDRAGTIASINKNCITYKDDFVAALDYVISEATKDGNDLAKELRKKDTYIDRYSFSVVAKADKGTLIVSEDTFAAGSSDNKATGKQAVALGRGNISYGDFSTTFGRDNQANYGGIAVGHLNKALGDRSAAVGGYNNVNNAKTAFVTGNSNEVKAEAEYSFTAGLRNVAKGMAQTVVGKGNAVLDDALFIVGNGEFGYNDQGELQDVTARSNAFVVHEDGRATISKSPVNAMDVVNLGMMPLTKVDSSVKGPNANVSGKHNFSYGNAGTNITTADNAFAFGEDATVKLNSTATNYTGAHFGLAFGRSAKVNEPHGKALGFSVTANGSQTVVGVNNEVKPGINYQNLEPVEDSALFIVGNGSSWAKREDGSYGTVRSNAFVSYTDGHAEVGREVTADDTNLTVATKGYVDTSVANLVDSAPEALNTLNELATALQNHEDAYDSLLEVVGNKADIDDVEYMISRIDIPDPITEWDYLIDNVDDFTTEKLAKMSGTVLVKDITVPHDLHEYIDILRPVHLPESITKLAFSNCSIAAWITGTPKASIIGLVGSSLKDDSIGRHCTTIDSFGSVEFCKDVDIKNSTNIRHCYVETIHDCKNIEDIVVMRAGSDMWGRINIKNCSRINGVTFEPYSIYYDEDWCTEFKNCSHISNIINNATGLTITYENCTFVDGDTCDGYYSEEDTGKVKLITTNGALDTIEVYTKAEVDQLIAKAIEEALSYRSLSSSQN